MPYERSTQDKVLDVGASVFGSIALCTIIFFYPALVIGVQVGMGYDTYDEGVFPGVFAGLPMLAAIFLSQWRCRNENLICALLLIGLYIVCFWPFLQWLHWVNTAEYISAVPDNFDKEPFQGFDWWWDFKFMWFLLKLMFGGYAEE